MPLAATACFAPPLTDERLEEYRALADTAEAEVRDAMQVLLACAEQWWGLEWSSPAGSRPHPVGSGQRADGTPRPAPTIVPLDAPIAKALYEHIPWKRELDGYEALFDGLQQDRAERNAARLDAWRAACRELLLAAAFTPAEREWLASPRRKMMRAMVAAMADCEGGDAYLDQVLTIFATNQDALRDEARRMNAVNEDLRQIDAGQREAPVPKPPLESTALRDAAMHLLWFARELDLDREPITADKV